MQRNDQYLFLLHLQLIIYKYFAMNYYIQIPGGWLSIKLTWLLWQTTYTCTSLPYDWKGRGFKPRIHLLIVLEDTFEILFNSIYFNSILSIMCYRRFHGREPTIGFKGNPPPYCSQRGKFLSCILLIACHFKIWIGPDTPAWFLRTSSPSSFAQNFPVFSNIPSNWIVGAGRVHGA